METAKQIAGKTISNLPQGSSWEKIFYELYVVKKIEDGLIAEKEGRAVTHSQVKKMLAE